MKFNICFDCIKDAFKPLLSLNIKDCCAEFCPADAARAAAQTAERAAAQAAGLAKAAELAAAQAAAHAKADIEFLAKQASVKAESEAARLKEMKTPEFEKTLCTVGKVGLIVGGISLVGFGIYKAAPAVIKLFKKADTAQADFEEDAFEPVAEDAAAVCPSDDKAEQ